MRVGILRREREESYIDYSLIFIILFLLAFGLIMLYSTSSYEAALDFGDSAYYFKHQLIPTLLGLVGMIVMSYIPYRILARLAMPIYLASAILLILIIPFGKMVNGAKRWLIFMGVSIQPAEAAKVATIIFTATIIIKLKRNLMTYKGFGAALLFPFILAAMVYFITRNLSSAIIIMGITVVMLFISTPGYKRYILAAAILLGVVALLVILIANSDQTSGMNYRFERKVMKITKAHCSATIVVIGMNSGRRSVVIMSNLIDQITKEYLKSDVPDFRPGDSVKVHVRIKEGDKERTQIFEGLVIKKRGGGISETFTVRKISYGVGVERTFPVHTPLVAKIELVRTGKVRRAKLNYIRTLSAKAARIKEAHR